MAISAIYKGLFLATLLIGVFAEEILDQVISDDLESVIVDVEKARLREEARLIEEQAANAVYNFASSIVDGIMDNVQIRNETRKGHSVTGSYEYKDGFFYHKVNYVADKNGYRVISEKMEPLGDGPRFNPDGHADVQTSIDGQNFAYSITKDDIGKFNDLAREAREKLIKKAQAARQAAA